MHLLMDILNRLLKLIQSPEFIQHDKLISMSVHQTKLGKQTYFKVQSSIIYNSQDMEAT